MNNPIEPDVIPMLLRSLPQPCIPADLVAAIESETIYKKAWWESEAFRLRWVPALVGLGTALGVLWLSKIQKQPDPRATLPVAAAPERPKVTLDALLPQNNDEMPNSEKGESREHKKS